MRYPAKWNSVVAMMNAGLGRLCTAVVLGLAGWAVAQQPPAASGDLNRLVRASMRTDNPILQAGRPVWVDFTLTNLTENRLTLRVPEFSVEGTEVAEMGLPLEHVFSGPGFTGPILRDDKNERHDSKPTIKPRNKVPAIKLAPHGSVGMRLDLTQYYDSLSRPGQYTLTWQPYEASLTSTPLAITILAERQAVIITDYGKMTIRFYYDRAPQHVQNFIDLVENRFYDNLTFNRIIPGGLIQGGDPLGNRRGVRKDGKRIKAEFNDAAFEMGTVGMCRSPQDPDSASCQFFICLGRQPAFDGHQTAFGYLEGDTSFETLKRIAAVPTIKQQGMDDWPRRPVYIRAISLENVPERSRTADPHTGPRPASQPAVSISPDDSAADAEPAASGDLPGLRAQGKVGARRTTTATNPS